MSTWIKLMNTNMRPSAEDPFFSRYWKVVAITFLILILGLALIKPLTQPIRAESDLLVDLKRDNFTSEKWVASTENVIVNTSIHRMHLGRFNTTDGNNEDLTNYTEYEENEGAIDQVQVINSTTAYFKTDLYYGAYLSKDYGEGYFDDFTIDVDIYWLGEFPASGINRHYYCFISDYEDDGSGIGGNTSSHYMVFRLNRASVANEIRWFVQVREAGTVYQSGWTVDNTIRNSWLYFRFQVEDDTARFLCYDYPNRTSLRFSYNITHTSDISDYQYVIPIASADLGAYPNTYITGYVKNINLNIPVEQYYESGNFYSSDIMANNTNEAYSIYSEVEIPSSTTIELFTSPDNSTWTSHGVIDNGGYVGNFASLLPAGLKPCYVRFRLNSSNGVSTPFVDYYHVTTESTSGINVTGSWRFLNITSYSIPVGVLNYGNLTSLVFKDGKLMSVQETAGTPGFDLRFNVSNVPADAVALGVVGYWDYSGNPAHVVEGAVWNWTADAWVQMGTFTDVGGFMWMNVSMSAWRLEDVMRNNTIMMRVDHTSPGNTGHTIFFDVIQVRAFVPSAVGGVVNRFLNPFWFVILIMVALVVLWVIKSGKLR